MISFHSLVAMVISCLGGHGHLVQLGRNRRPDPS
jgi:hypothetical protein